MRLLTIPNWSIGRDRAVLREFEEVIVGQDLNEVQLHYLQSDLDHNRTVSAFSGPQEFIFKILEELCEIAFDRIDLGRHIGAHPRIGALDVCPFVLLPESASEKYLPLVNQKVDEFAKSLSERYQLPIFLYEKSEKGRHEADLPTLRKGGFGMLLERELDPDFGPRRAHPRLGATVMGVRDFLIAMNANLKTADSTLAKKLAKEIRDLRAQGDPRFLGVRALGFTLASRELSQVSMNLTLPDLTPPDPILEWVMRHASDEGVGYAGSELIGVIREKDLAGATRLPIEPAQIVPDS